MNIRLAVADKNVEYIERLTSVLEEYEDLRLYVYTDEKSLAKALEERHFDILLFDPSVYDDGMQLEKAMLRIVLLDSSSELPESCRKFLTIKKYQRISWIYKNILELYADVCGDSSMITGQGKAMAIAFYSPAGGCGKTTIALTTAVKLARQGHRTFYLNLEDVASDDCFLVQSGEKGMSEMLGFLNTNTNFAVKMQGLMQKKEENLFYLNHFDTPNDVYELEVDEIAELITTILKTGLFDFLVIDMGISMDRKALKVFDLADKLVIIEKPDKMAIGKLKCFYSQAHIMNEYSEKMLRILNFDTGGAEAFMTELPMIGRISMMQNPDAEQFITMLAGSAAGNFVNGILV